MVLTFGLVGMGVVSFDFGLVGEGVFPVTNSGSSGEGDLDFLGRIGRLLIEGGWILTAFLPAPVISSWSMLLSSTFQ